VATSLLVHVQRPELLKDLLLVLSRDAYPIIPYDYLHHLWRREEC
jgi:hypothetical protein